MTGLLGHSRAIEKLNEAIALAARTESTVLIQGESGTGKELVARAIHSNSRRSAGPFVAVNCAALVDTLLESELFGHERGAFTGAIAQKKGKFEQASHGTLFLDEIGELSQVIQAKLLRALQELTIDRVGGTRPIPVDIRIVAATNRDLEKAVGAGSFREDLYYRLNVIPIFTPALREHLEDIPELALHFVEQYSKQAGREVLGLSRDAESILGNYCWPGNVRQLQNAIQYAIARGTTDMVAAGDLPVLKKSPGLGAHAQTFHQIVHETKRSLLESAIHQADRDYKRAALSLGLHPKGMHRILRQFDLIHLLK